MQFTIPEEARRGSAMSLEAVVSRKLRHSMVWMVVGLFTTMLTMFAIAVQPAWARLALQHPNIIMLLELGVVFLFSMRAYTASPAALKVMFLTYSILNGFTFFVLVLAYGLESAVYALLGALSFFVAFAIVGFVMKRDLSSLYPYLLAAVFAMIISSLATFFLSAGAVSTLSLILGYVGVVVFAVFTAVDVNRIKHQLMAYAMQDETILDRIALAGALSLYLDFINIFLSLLRIFGNRR